MNFPICKEMKIYRQMLDDRKIKWVDKSDRYMCRTHFHMENGDLISVINGQGSYGGATLFNGYNAGLLELMAEMINEGDPVGELTATEVIELIENAYNMYQ